MNFPGRKLIWLGATGCVFCAGTAMGNDADETFEDMYLAPDDEYIEPAGAMHLLVIDPYAELRTGPGRGYPIFYAVEQGESIQVIARRPGWFEVRTENGQTGWTSTRELSRTMQASGAPADLPSVSYGDYLQRNWQVGMRSGTFIDGELDGSDSFSAVAGYRINSWLGLELELGKILNNDVRGTTYGLNALFEPFSHWPISPFLSLGVGTMDIDSQPKLVPLSIDSADFETYSLGSNYYLGRNFLIQASFRWHSIDAEQQTERTQSWSIGFNAFF